MRRLCLARAVLSMCVTLVGLPSSLVMAADVPAQAVHVTGESQVAGGVTAGRAFNFENVNTSHESLDGCYFLEVAGGGEAGSWGTLTVYDGSCQYFGSVEGRERTWEGEWFVPHQGPGGVWNLHQLTDPVWLRGQGRNEGASAVMNFGIASEEPGDFEAWENGFEGGAIEAWLFPTPPPWQHPIETLR